MTSIDAQYELTTEKAASHKLKEYFSRIGYDGATSPTLATLQAIHQKHAQSIPFENLNPYLRIPVLIDIESIQQKMLGEGRGGYCFEQNGLLKWALESIGFKVKTLAGRVLWNQPEGIITARGHMLLLVEVDNLNYIADVGFGGLTLTAPLLMEKDIEQETPHEQFRLIQPENDYILQARIRGEWKPIYRFDLTEQYPQDYEVTNWYLSNNPNSHFVTGIIAAKPSADRRTILRGNEYVVHHLHGETERREILTKEELKEILTKEFEIRIPDVANLEELLEKAVARK